MSEHMCPIHGVEFFKTPKMRGYAHPVTDAEGNKVYKNGKQVWCNEDDLTTGDATPEPTPQPERQEPMINREKQSSIEAQNARTNLTNLLVAGKLTEASIKALDPLETALVAQLCDRAGVAYRGFKDKQGEMVEPTRATDAEREAAAKTAKTITTLGKLRTEVAKLGEGYQTQAEQEKVFGQPFDSIADFPGAYLVAWEQRYG